MEKQGNVFGEKGKYGCIYTKQNPLDEGEWRDINFWEKDFDGAPLRLCSDEFWCEDWEVSVSTKRDEDMVEQIELTYEYFAIPKKVKLLGEKWGLWELKRDDYFFCFQFK